MTDILQELDNILGKEFLDEIAIKSDDKNPDNLTNSKDIFCQCKTLILKANHAKLILPTKNMLEYETKLNFLQRDDKTFKNLKRGCYWLVDDMYKFEQIGYTKEITTTNISSETQEDKSDESSINCNSLRYLICAECNLGPLGWSDSSLGESYLYVW